MNGQSAPGITTIIWTNITKCYCYCVHHERPSHNPLTTQLGHHLKAGIGLEHGKDWTAISSSGHQGSYHESLHYVGIE